MKWYHCRACGEEGLTPEDERCPHCGTRDPVTLCARCERPILDAQPWSLGLRSADAPQEGEQHFSYHETCYGAGKRRLLRQYRPPNWTVRLDSRDPHLPLSPLRWGLGIGLMFFAGALAIGFIVTSPKPVSVLPGEWQTAPLDAQPENPWGRFWAQSPSVHASLPKILFAILGIALGLWGIVWGLSRRRAFLLEEILDESLPPDDGKNPPR